MERDLAMREQGALAKGKTLRQHVAGYCGCFPLRAKVGKIVSMGETIIKKGQDGTTSA